MNTLSSYIHHNAVENVPDIAFGDMHHGVYIMTLLAWTWVLGAFWMAFGGEGESRFMVVISTVYFVIFFSIPIVMVRTGRKFVSASPNSQSFGRFLRTHIDTANGPLTGREALIQIVLIPVCLALCITFIAFAVMSARNTFGG